MARDEQLPIECAPHSAPTAHTPIGVCIPSASCVHPDAAVNRRSDSFAIAATGMIYLSYLICQSRRHPRRLRGWPRTAAPFSAGQVGIPITRGLLWGAGMLVNFAWPRVATNPTPNQTASC